MACISIAATLVAFFCLAYAGPSAKDVQTDLKKAAVNYRLPLNIKPINYKISLKPYLNEADAKQFTFDGECYIEIQAAEKTKEIRLHMKNLNISVSEYYRKGSARKSNLPRTSPNSLSNIVVYNLNNELLPNVSYILHFKYAGSMAADMFGFYRSYYRNSKNVTKWLGATQFEPHYARRAFPSFDEPKFKATFDLSITRHRSLRSTGPTRIIAIKHDGEYVTDVYKTTNKMSTYLLAFIVSDFNERTDGKFSVLARPEYSSQTKYSFHYGRKLLSAFENYLGISYYSLGNDRMQMAAIPDFSSNAMENWGLLTYKEQALLYDQEHTNLKSKQFTASIVAHEQIHMWFGNLVTCDWWSYLWLNEGFARYFQCFGPDLIESNMNVEQQFVVDFLQNVMEMDATNDTYPLSNENTNTDVDMKRMFNSISYSKGASFIRMTKHILGETKFKKSLKEYLIANEYNTTTPADIFAAWKKNMDIGHAYEADDYFASYTNQVGFPVVTFNRKTEIWIEVSQKRFLLKDFDKVDTNLMYTVPITYTTDYERDFQNLFPGFFLSETPLVIQVMPDTKWVMGNIQATGYYRVNYDDKTWNEIKKALNGDKWSGIHELNRAQIVDDLLNLARAGEIDYSLAFDVLEYLETETNYLPWTSAFNAFRFIDTRLGTQSHKYFAHYIHHITNKAYNKFGFEEKPTDTPLDIYAREKILAWSCKYGKTDCISKARSYFNQNLKRNPVPVNIRSVVYCTAMREGNESDYDKLYSKYKNETVATELPLILNSLGCVRDSKLVSRFFHMIISPEIRLQDKFNSLNRLYSENNENVDLVFDLVDQNLEQLSDAIGGYSFAASIVSTISERFTTEHQLEKLKAFNVKHKDKFGSSISKLQSAVESVQFNLDWSRAKLGSIKSFLYQHALIRKK